MSKRSKIRGQIREAFINYVQASGLVDTSYDEISLSYDQGSWLVLCKREVKMVGFERAISGLCFRVDATANGFAFTPKDVRIYLKPTRETYQVLVDRFGDAETAMAALKSDWAHGMQARVEQILKDAAATPAPHPTAQ